MRWGQEGSRGTHPYPLALKRNGRRRGRGGLRWPEVEDGSGARPHASVEGRKERERVWPC
jgi:hypothetical protein